MDEQQPIRVDIPGVGPVEFPASMSSDDVNAAAKRLHDEANYHGVPIPGRSAPLETGAPPDNPVLAGVKNMLQPLSHPQTAGDMAGLLIPSAMDTPMLRGMLRTGVDTVKEAAPGNPLSFPGRFLRIGYQKASDLSARERSLGNVAIDRYAPSLGAEPAANPTAVPKVPYGAADVPAPTSNAAPTPAASSALSPIDKAALVKQGYTTDVIQRIEGQLKPIASHAAPAVEEAGPLPNTVDAPLPSHPLTQPRVDQGADVVGRTSGLGKQAVRDATGPVLGEAPGDASPILPRGPSQKIIERLKEMGPQGSGTVPEAERDAYVMRANGDKARAQIKAYLDALRAVGFSGAAGVAARKALTSSMSSDPTPQGPQ